MPGGGPLTFAAKKPPDWNVTLPVESVAAVVALPGLSVPPVCTWTVPMMLPAPPTVPVPVTTTSGSAAPFATVPFRSNVPALAVTAPAFAGVKLLRLTGPLIASVPAPALTNDLAVPALESYTPVVWLSVSVRPAAMSNVAADPRPIPSGKSMVASPDPVSETLPFTATLKPPNELTVPLALIVPPLLKVTLPRCVPPFVAPATWKAPPLSVRLMALTPCGVGLLFAISNVPPALTVTVDFAGRRFCV